MTVGDVIRWTSIRGAPRHGVVVELVPAGEFPKSNIPASRPRKVDSVVVRVQYPDDPERAWLAWPHSKCKLELVA